MGIDNRIKALRIKEALRVIKPYGLNDLERNIIQTPEGLKTGYKSIDSLIRIPQGAITIIASRPSHGKTTFLMNLFLNMTDIYKDKRFFFFSYEERKSQIGIKLLNILSGGVLDENQNITQLQEYIKAQSKAYREIEKGKKKFETLTENGRLWIIDDPLDVDGLVDTIIYLKETYNNVGAVFIDYIQKVKIEDRFNTRQLEIQKISERILETANSLSLPIILGAQVNREVKDFKDLTLDKLRDLRDIVQDANLIIGLFNKAMQRAQETKESLKKSIVDLNLTIMKNRNGAVNQDFILKFERPLLRIKEWGESENW